jgi:hypothetical protein
MSGADDMFFIDKKKENKNIMGLDVWATQACIFGFFIFIYLFLILLFNIFLNSITNLFWFWFDIY